MDVLVTRSRGQIGRGKVKYVGPLPGRRDTYIGIELGPGQGKRTCTVVATKFLKKNPFQGRLSVRQCIVINLKPTVVNS